jgi:hypothetical protein
MTVGKYVKSLTALLITLLTAFLSYVEDLTLAPDEVQAIGALALITVSTWLLPNLQPDKPPAVVPDPWAPEAETVTMRPPATP